MIYTLHKVSWIRTTLDDAWDFIRNPSNLNRITPPDMNFEIRTHLPEQMVEGMRVEYRVNIPLLGRRKWISEIKDIVPRHSFVDEQIAGPYRYWHHHHVIEEIDKGVVFTDRVHYTPPLGPLGRIANACFIRNKLEDIFAFRERRLREIMSGQ